MVILFGSVLFLLLLLFMKEAYRPLHALFTVILFFILFQFFFIESLYPLFILLFGVAAAVPYGKGLLWSAAYLLIGQLIVTLLIEHEYEAIGELVKLAVRVSLVSFWLMQLTPAFRQLEALIERLQ